MNSLSVYKQSAAFKRVVYVLLLYGCVSMVLALKRATTAQRCCFSSSFFPHFPFYSFLVFRWIDNADSVLFHFLFKLLLLYWMEWTKWINECMSIWVKCKWQMIYMSSHQLLDVVDLVIVANFKCELKGNFIEIKTISSG